MHSYFVSTEPYEDKNIHFLLFCIYQFIGSLVYISWRFRPEVNICVSIPVLIMFWCIPVTSCHYSGPRGLDTFMSSVSKLSEIKSFPVYLWETGHVKYDDGRGEITATLTSLCYHHCSDNTFKTKQCSWQKDKYYKQKHNFIPKLSLSTNLSAILF